MNDEIFHNKLKYPKLQIPRKQKTEFWSKFQVYPRFQRRYGYFRFLAAIIRKYSHKRPWIENALPFIHQPDRVARKACDVSAADWRYQHMKKYRIFHMCCYNFSQSWKSLQNTAVCLINNCKNLIFVCLTIESFDDKFLKIIYLDP